MLFMWSVQFCHPVEKTDSIVVLEITVSSSQNSLQSTLVLVIAVEVSLESSSIS